LHVAARLSGDDPGGVDSTIVNPKHLSAALRGDVCRQCHLQGEARVVRRGRALAEYRPGLPWDQFVTTFLRRPDLADYHKSVGQFEQLEVSKCFISSGGKLGCVSCHDPHAKPAPAEADRFYRGRCLTCHDSRGCSAPAAERAARKDSCVACHMPRADSSSIAHAAVTDHRILRRPAPAGAPHASPGAVPVVAYPAGPHAPPAEERERDLGVALVRQAEKYGPTVGRAAARQLSAAVGRWPDDAVAWSSLAYVLGTPKPTDAALRAARTAVELTPHSEAAQRVLADLAVRGGDAETGVAAAGEAIRLNPSSVEHRLLRAAAYLLRGRYAEAEADCRAALAIHPLHPEAWMYLAVARHKQGDAAGARQHADTALRLTTSPRMRDYYRDWFAAKTR
jgi:Flp pilus assembly protein TadD